MKLSRNVVIGFASAITLTLFTCQPASAQEGRFFQYASKFLCGAGDGSIMVAGHYLTAINIHNPSDGPAKFQWKVARALPELEASVPSPFANGMLGPDGASELVCRDIQRQSKQTPTFLTGFVVIEADSELDVVPVYTATDPSGRSIALEVKPTPARVLPPHKPQLLPDLSLDGGCLSQNNTQAGATIKNVGQALAGTSTTRFTFTPQSASGTPDGPSTFTDVPTPPLAPGASVSLTTTIPSVCFKPNCGVSISIDVLNVVVESNETNNTAMGVCIG